MPTEKTVAVNLRMSPQMKELLVAAAEHQRRSLTNTIEVLIESYCLDNGLAPPRAKSSSYPSHSSRQEVK
jgi:hypothetical protein